jgi:phage gp36-like protein
MAYTSQAQIAARWGSEEVVLSADRDPQDGVADVASIDAVCADASSFIDSYLARAGYSVPVAPVPDVLVEKASDIAVYKLSQGQGPYTKEKRKRYDDAIAWLEMVGDGKLELPGAPDDSKVARGTRSGGYALKYQAGHLRGGLL